MTQYGSIGLIDFSHMLVVQYKALGKSQGPNDAENQTMTQLAGIRQSCEHVIVCLDSKPYKRSEIYPDYKAQREREPELVAMWKRCVDRLTLDGYQTAKAPGAEADDVIATLAAAYTSGAASDEGYGCFDVRIYGTDKDCLQCVNDHVRCFSYTGHGEWEIRDADWVLKKWEVPPRDMALMLAICGDTSDNIPGIQGLGQKTAAKLIAAYKNPEGMAVAMAAAVEAAKVTGKLPAFWKKYAEGCASLPRWIRLTTLDRDAPLEKHPLKYLEKLEQKPLVITGQTDVQIVEEDLVEPDWDAVEEQVEAETREAMASSLPVDKPAPRIGKDPNADEYLRSAAQERVERAAQDARQRIVDGKIDETGRENPSGPRMKLTPAQRDEYDRFGQKRPDPTVMDPRVPPEAQEDIRKLGAQLGKEIAAATGAAAGGLQAAGAADPKAAPPASAANGSAAPSPGTAESASASIVPKTQGPRKSESTIDENGMTLAPIHHPNWALSLQPQTAGHAVKIAITLFNSRLYSRFGNEAGVAAVIFRGRELGLGMTTALDAFNVIGGKPCASAQLISSLAEQDPNHDWTMLISSSDNEATFECKHKKHPAPTRFTYTIDDAKLAGLVQPGTPWVKRPRDMLIKTCKSKLHKMMFPGATLGLHYEEEDGGD